jgi:pimeloyl-ACP methyl ester carboxylesterase
MTKPIGMRRVALLFAAGCAIGCHSGDVTEGSATRDANADPDAGQGVELQACPVMVNDKDCDREKLPIVFIHGNSSAGDGFSYPAQLFASNGYCALRIRAIDYDAISRGDDAATYAAVEAQLDQVIAQLLDRTGAKQVDLFAHAQGAAYGARYVAAHHEMFGHYIHIAGGVLSSNPGGVKTLCLSSTGDRPVACETTKNVTFDNEQMDHFAVGSSREAFREAYAFLNDAAQPVYDTVQCGEPVVIEGRALAFGDNERMSGGVVEVYALGADPRLRGEPLTRLEIRDDGSVGPWTVQRGVAYEFKLIAKAGDGRPTRYVYFPPFQRSDRLLRFTFESRNAAALATSRMANLSDATAALWIRRTQGAFLAGRDELMVDGYPAVNAEDAMLRATVTGLYVLDQDGDMQSSGGSVIRETFVGGTDVYLPTSQPAFIDVSLNGGHLKVPNWPSQTGGLSIVWVN